MAFAPKTFADSNAVLTEYNGIAARAGAGGALPVSVVTALNPLFAAAPGAPARAVSIKEVKTAIAGVTGDDAKAADFKAFQAWADNLAKAEEHITYLDELIENTAAIAIADKAAMKTAVKNYYYDIVNSPDPVVLEPTQALAALAAPAAAAPANIADLITANTERLAHLEKVATFKATVASIKDAAHSTDATKAAVDAAVEALDLDQYPSPAVPTPVDFFQGLVTAAPDDAAREAYIKLLAEAIIAEPKPATPARDLSVLEAKVAALRADVEKAAQDVAQAEETIAKTANLIKLAKDAQAAVTTLQAKPADQSVQNQVIATGSALNAALGKTEEIKGTFDTPENRAAVLASITTKIAELEARSARATAAKAAAEAAKTDHEANLKMATGLLQVLKDNPNYPAIAAANVKALLDLQEKIYRRIDGTNETTAEVKHLLKTHADHLILLNGAIELTRLENLITACHNVTISDNWTVLSAAKQEALMPHVYRLVGDHYNTAAPGGAAAVAADLTPDQINTIIAKAQENEKIRQAIIASQAAALFKGLNHASAFNGAETEHIGKMIYNRLEAATRGTISRLSDEECAKLTDEINKRLAEKVELIEYLFDMLPPDLDSTTRQSLEEYIEKQAADWFCSETSLDDAKHKGLAYVDLISNNPSMSEVARAIAYADDKNSRNAYASNGKNFDVVRDKKGAIVVKERSATGVSLSASAFSRPQDIGEYTTVWEKSGDIHAIDKSHIGKDMGFAATLRLFDEQCVSEIDKTNGKRKSAALHIRHVGNDLKHHMIQSMITWLENNSEARIATLPSGITGNAFHEALKTANLTGRLIGDAKTQFEAKAKTSGAPARAFAAAHHAAAGGAAAPAHAPLVAPVGGGGP